MKYQINIQGMECTGCSNLIKMEMEDHDLTNIRVNLEEHKAVFDGGDTMEKVKTTLTEVFSTLPEYHFSNLEPVVKD